MQGHVKKVGNPKKKKEGRKKRWLNHPLVDACVYILLMPIVLLLLTQAGAHDAR